MSIRLESEIGTELQLQLAGGDGRVRCTLIGIIPNELLILDINDKLASQLSNQDALPDITLRGISRGLAFGFNASCLRVLTTPKSMVILRYPQTIQQQAVRKNRRVKCLLPARFAYDRVDVMGVIVDLSNSGCHFQTTTDLNDAQSALIKISQQGLITFELPGKQTPKTIKTVIRNTYVSADCVHIGFEFIGLDSASVKVLDEYIALSFDIQPF